MYAPCIPAFELGNIFTLFMTVSKGLQPPPPHLFPSNCLWFVSHTSWLASPHPPPPLHTLPSSSIVKTVLQRPVQYTQAEGCVSCFHRVLIWSCVPVAIWAAISSIFVVQSEDVKVKYKYTSVVPLVPAHIGTNALLKQKNLHQVSYKRFILLIRNRKEDGDSSMIALYNLSGSRSRPETVHLFKVALVNSVKVQ
jgi:hypothetical protein